MHKNKFELNLQRIHVSHLVFSISTGTFSAIDHTIYSFETYLKRCAKAHTHTQNRYCGYCCCLSVTNIYIYIYIRIVRW